MKLRLALISIFLLFCCVFSIAGDNGPTCSNRLGKGTYGYSCTGAVGGLPFAAYGVVTGDGRGQYNGHGKFSLNGELHAWTHNTRKFEPSTVNPDCTGTVKYEVTVDGYDAPDSHFDFVIVDDGREIKGFRPIPGTLLLAN